MMRRGPGPLIPPLQGGPSSPDPGPAASGPRASKPHVLSRDPGRRTPGAVVSSCSDVVAHGASPDGPQLGRWPLDAPGRAPEVLGTPGPGPGRRVSWSGTALTSFPAAHGSASPGLTREAQPRGASSLIHSAVTAGRPRGPHRKCWAQRLGSSGRCRLKNGPHFPRAAEQRRARHSHQEWTGGGGWGTAGES